MEQLPIIQHVCTRSLTDRTKASDAFNAGSIPVGCIYITLGICAVVKRMVIMNQNNQSRLEGVKDKLLKGKDWILDHRKVVMPAILIVCVLITVFVAVNANQRDKLEKEAEAAALAAAEQQTEEEVQEMPVYDLEENAYPEVNNVVRAYYDAQASGDMGIISGLNTYLNDIQKIKVEELSKYIESYPQLDVYTKPGLTDNTYVAYVCSEVKFYDLDTTIPGMQTYYIGQDEDGNYYINNGTYDDTVSNYIKEVTLQDDVVDLNNKVVVAYNDLLAEDENLSEFLAYMKEKINEDVGEILAQADQPEQTEEETGEQTEQATEETAPVTFRARATDVVNIRVSDSEQADKLGKAQVDEEFTVLEQKENGWSKIEYEGKDAYIKSDYLEVISEEPASDAQETDTDSTDNEDQAQDSSTDTSTDTASTSTASTGKTPGDQVRVKETVRIRKSASTDSDVLGTAYVGDTFELVMEQADGWSRVKYKGNNAYIKTEYLE